MKRALDIFASFVLVVIFSPILLLLGILIRLTSKGPAIHWSKRVGLNNQIFEMPKFRSMYIGTPQLATDKLGSQAQNHITPIGKFIRKTSLDELPQFYSIIKGDMSLVGPRPALYNQYELVKLRTKEGLHQLKPGLTGWAQINGRDNISDDKKVSLDLYYLQQRSIILDLKILIFTFLNVVGRKNVSH